MSSFLNITLPNGRNYDQPNALFINNEFVQGKGEDIDVIEPATENRIITIKGASPADVDDAVAAARRAFEDPSWAELAAADRGAFLYKIAELIDRDRELLASIDSLDNGKTYTSAMAVDIDEAYNVFRYYAAMITRKIGPALAAGCTVVSKSPGETPFTCNALAELSRRAGIPKGVVNFVTALENTAEVGKVLTTDPRIKKISFTGKRSLSVSPPGSTNVGKLLMQQAALTMKKVSFELGGNAAFIVFDDCPDIDLAVAGAMASKFRSSGQTCVCANRIYVQRGIHDQFIEKFAEQVKAFKVSHGFDNNVTHGPLIHERAALKVERHVRDAQDKGAKILVGGERLSLGPTFYSPTVLVGVTTDMEIAHEETFGPVAGFTAFDTEKEVVALANSTPVGLAGYFYSRDIGRIYRVAEALEVGMVGVNTGIISDAAAPFGGIKESGIGREGSKYGIDDFTIIKTITIANIHNELQG